MEWRWHLVSGGLSGGVHTGVSGTLLLVLQGMDSMSASFDTPERKINIKQLLLARVVARVAEVDAASQLKHRTCITTHWGALLQATCSSQRAYLVVLVLGNAGTSQNANACRARPCTSNLPEDNVAMLCTPS